MKHTPVKGDAVTRSYSGNKVYENGNLKMILTEEGYVEKEGNSFNHYYYLKDHLGNNRVVLDASGNIVQSTEYYPFGAHYTKSTSQEKQPYKFGGKELDHLFDLDCYDFEARMYDPVLGRFMTMDPLAEKYYSISPYAYCLNNPVKYIDRDGKQPVAPLPVGAPVPFPTPMPNNPNSMTGGDLKANLETIWEGVKLAFSLAIDHTFDVAPVGYTPIGKIIDTFSEESSKSESKSESDSGKATTPSNNKDNNQKNGEKNDKTPEFKKSKPNTSGKDGAKDAPSWAKGNKPHKGESGNDFAKRLMDEKYGKGNYDAKKNPEYSKIRKWGDRSFE